MERGQEGGIKRQLYIQYVYTTAQMCTLVPTFMAVFTKFFISSSTMYKHSRFSLCVHMRSTYKYIHELHTG